MILHFMYRLQLVHLKVIYAFNGSCLFECQIQPLFQIDLVLTCEELLESWPVKKLFGCLHIHRWYAIQKPRELYPNAPETLLPQWCKRGGDYVLANYPRNGKSDRAQRWVAKRYAKWWITDDYSTSGVNICNKVKPLQDDFTFYVQIAVSAFKSYICLQWLMPF